MLQAAAKNGAAIRFQIRTMQPQTGAGSFATARAVKISYAWLAEKNYKIAAAQILDARSRTQLIS